MSMTRRPAEVFPPGEYIRDELEARGWTQADLAEVLDKDIAGISQILTGKRRITPETATGLAHAFGTTAEVWLNLDSRFRLAKMPAEPGTELRSKIYSQAPVREMVKRRWIAGSRNPEVLERQVCDFLGVSTLDDGPEEMPHAARKKSAYGVTTPSQRAWLVRVRTLAHAVTVAQPFRAADFDVVISQLKPLFANPEDVRRVPRILSQNGIRLVIVEHLAQTKMDGVCVWLSPTAPVVALSLRYGRIDSFWHTLLHELAHVRAEDGLRSAPVIDSDISSDVDSHVQHSQVELNATRFALETAIRSEVLEDFMLRVAPLYSIQRITAFARRIGVHPGIVVGQLAGRGEVLWSRYGKKSLVPIIRDYVTASALTDGWGHVLPPFELREQTGG